MFSQEEFTSKTRPLKIKERLELYRSTSSMFETRRRELKPEVSFTTLALDLATNDIQLSIANNLISLPTGIPCDMNNVSFYTQLIEELIKKIRWHKTNSSIISAAAHLLRDLTVNTIPARKFIEVVSLENRNRYSSQKKTPDSFAFRIWFEPDATTQQNQEPLSTSISSVGQSENQLVAEPKDRLRNKTKTLVSKILLLSIETAKSAESFLLFKNIFGNVDVCIIPNVIILQQDTPIPKLNLATQQKIQEIRPELFVKIASYLDHGQLLNLAELGRRGIYIQGEDKLGASPYDHYFQDIAYYKDHSVNGELMLRALPDELSLLHLTEHSNAIIQSKELRNSRAGCMGNMVYTTTLADQNALGGHTMGLYHRKFPHELCDPEKFILLNVRTIQNRLTNWIEKLGRGRLFLEARNRLISNSRNEKTRNNGTNSFFKGAQFASFSIIKSAQIKCLEQYSRLYPLFLFLKDYQVFFKEKKEPHLTFINYGFNTATKILNKIAYQSDGQPNYTIINNIFFEVLKDYIILFQADELSQQFKKVRSFNMHNQYLIFFEIFPQLRENWDTGLFPIEIEKVLDILKKWKIIQSESDEITFKRFFLDRFSYYINIGCLEGARYFPPPDKVTIFNELANYLPNLVGNLFNSIIKKEHGKTCFYNAYLSELRQCYDVSYGNRKLDVLIKSGMCGTDEIGVRNTASVNFYSIRLKKQNDFYHAEKADFLRLKIDGLSNKNGFTKRVNQHLDELDLDIQIQHLNDPDFDLSRIAQIIFNHYYLLPFQIENDKAITKRSAKHFEIRDTRIHRMTHGAMHAARVATYIKLTHNFRVTHNDTASENLNHLASSLELSTTALLHLTQIAALFHDVSRKDEGDDRWDEDSANECRRFLGMIRPRLTINIQTIIANIIAFKDNKKDFLASLQKLNIEPSQILQADYLRELIHDADCLDIMRVRGTFKVKYLHLWQSLTSDISRAATLNFVRKLRELIYSQGDLYKPCKIELIDGEFDSEPVLEANLDASLKCEYELNHNVYLRIMEDIKKIDFTYTPRTKEKSGQETIQFTP